MRWLLLLALAVGCRALEPRDYDGGLTLRGGIAQVVDDNQIGVGGIEFAFARRAWEIQPTIGAYFFEGAARYAYVGVRRRFDLSNRWELTPSFSVGLYDDSEVLDLGGAVEFLSGLTLAWRATETISIGLTGAHISNASLYEHNDGSEFLLLSVSIDLPGLFARRPDG